MSDEEKKAIEKIKKIVYMFPESEELKLLLNLIEKQSKEIEELKDKNKKLQDKAKELIFEKQELTSTLLDSTPNDKIKAKIEELDEEIKVKREIAKNPMDRVSGRLLTDSIVELEKTKKVLQSLLEKE